MSGQSRTLPLVLAVAAVVFFASCSTKPAEPEEVRSNRNIADSLMIQGYKSVDRYDMVAAWNSFDQALNIYASVDFREGVIDALLAMGRTKRISGDDEASEKLYAHAQGLADFSADPARVRSVLNHRGELALRQGNPVLAMELLGDRESDPLKGAERAEQLRLRASALYTISREEEAVSLLMESAAVALEADVPLEAAKTYYKLASISSLGARFAEAESWALKALDADKSEEYGPGIAADLRALAIISEKAGNLPLAEDYLRRSWLAWRGLGRPPEMEAARNDLEKITGREMEIP
jgi:tetratricopeptide (TPR) repeat protein